MKQWLTNQIEALEKEFARLKCHNYEYGTIILSTKAIYPKVIWDLSALSTVDRSNMKEESRYCFYSTFLTWHYASIQMKLVMLVRQVKSAI